MITTKYKLETDKFLFKSDYNNELNIIFDKFIRIWSSKNITRFRSKIK